MRCYAKVDALSQAMRESAVRCAQSGASPRPESREGYSPYLADRQHLTDRTQLLHRIALAAVSEFACILNTARAEGRLAWQNASNSARLTTLGPTLPRASMAWPWHEQICVKALLGTWSSEAIYCEECTYQWTRNVAANGSQGCYLKALRNGLRRNQEVGRNCSRVKVLCYKCRPFRSGASE